MDKVKAIVDYAQNDEAKEMRDALYSAIQDKVTAHIEAKKQEIAQTILSNPEPEIATAQDVAIENA
jgi:hypothetical protein